MNTNTENTQNQTAEAAPVANDKDVAPLLINDVDTFYKLLTQWHSLQTARTVHLLEVPNGTEVTIGEDKKLLLEGDALAGFKLGVEMSLHHYGTLPFQPAVEPQPETQAVAAGEEVVQNLADIPAANDLPA